MEKHLWEIKHSYYCSNINFYNNETYIEYDSFDAFLSEWEDADIDMNMIFRWDWKKYDDDERLYLYYMLQRKGIFLCNAIKVTNKDEEKVKTFLQPYFEYMKNLWLPFE